MRKDGVTEIATHFDILLEASGPKLVSICVLKEQTYSFLIPINQAYFAVKYCLTKSFSHASIFAKVFLDYFLLHKYYPYLKGIRSQIAKMQNENISSK